MGALPSGQRLVNACRWSASRESTFHECRKKYWYTYYGSWEGWPKTPFDTRPSIDTLASHLYMLKNMQPACMCMGSVVHKVIEESLKTIRQSRKLPESAQLVESVISAHDKAMTDSKQQRWKRHPKHHTNILEHYYGLPFGEAEEQASKDKAVSCINHWVTSAVVQNVLLDTRAEWLGIESTQTFSIDSGVEAIVVYDFFLWWKKADGSKMMIIFDWKTGQENSKIDDQMFAYALAATALYSIPVDALILSPFYLAAGPSGYKKYGVHQDVLIDPQALESTRSRLIASARQMLSLHPACDKEGLIPLPDPRLFSYPDDRRRCRRCPFQEVCTAADFQPKEINELRALCDKKECVLKGI
jgi:hypothetical protein